MEKIVIIPTYNEKDNVENIIRAVFHLNSGFHVLIIDDGSPDGTADIVKKLIPQFEGHLFIEERKGKLGLGTAYIHGFKWCIVNGPCNGNTIIFLKWMPISVTTQKT